MLKNKTKFITIITLILTLTVAMAFAGCSSEETGTSVGGAVGSSAEEPSAEPEEGVTYQLSLSYANEKYIETGDNSLARMIDNVSSELVIPEENEEEAVMGAINELKTVPEALSGAVTLVTDAVKVNKAVIDEGMCTVDLSSEGVYEMDMYTESYFIYQITNTILKSFDDIESVMFTVDGETVESLSYIDMTEPFTSSDVEMFNSPTLE